nr:hypothetical protein [Anaerolineae bacterium]
MQIGDDLLHTAPVATTINGVPGTRYVATTGTDADNSCRMEWKPCATVQYAVDQALAGDTVKVAEGAYTGAGSNVVLITESLTLQGGYTTTNWNASDPVAYPTYLDGQSVRRVVYITGPVTVTVAGFHIVNGDTPLSAEKYGGGLYIYTSTVHLARSWVYNNQALYSGDRGGGIYQEYGSLTITATQVYSNISNSTGGGIYYRDGTFALVNSQVYSNTAGSSGGGLYLTYADVTLTGNRVYTNTAQGGTANGGGVDLYRCYDQLLERNLFLDNQAGDRGGGIYEYALSTSMLTMTNNIIAANRADTGGDGLYLAGASSAQGHLRHNTVADNAEEGLRVGNFTVVMTNTVLVSHTVGITTSAAGASVTADHTLWYATAIYTDASGGGTILTTDDLSGDPKFVDLAILDYHIRGDSAALDAGVWAGVSEDIDGDARPAGQAPDIGADQYPLRVARWVGPASAPPCGVVTHTLRLTNLSTAPLAGVWLSDTLDANATFAGFVTASAGSAAYVAAGHTISWTGPVDTLAPTFITYTAQITPYLTDGTLLTHTATVSDGISVFDAASITVTVATEQATLKKSAPAQAAIGQVVTYTIAFTVPAGHVAYQPTVTDTLP